MVKGFIGVAFWLTCGLLSSAHADQDDWPMFNHDVKGTRHNPVEWRLNPWTVPHMRQLWRVQTPGAVTGTPVVADDRVYVGDWTGGFYKLRADNGKKVWSAQAIAPISASALVMGKKVIFGDQAGFIYGLDRDTGVTRWQIRPNQHQFAAVFASPTPIGPFVAIGLSSNEEEAAANPAYTCCSYRGSVILIDPKDGRLVWQTYFVSEAENAAGASGASLFSSPTYDDDLDLVYVATSNNYSEPANGRSDSIIALDAHTGAIRWESQRVVGDVSNFSMPIRENKDAGFGDSPQVYRLWNGRKVVGAGAKMGKYWTLDAATGEVLGERQVQVGGSLGGLFADSAVAGGIVFANGNNWANPFDFGVLPTEGLVTAFTGDTRHVLWQVRTPNSANQSGVAVANLIVYFSTCNPGTGDRLSNDSGTLHAVNALTGSTLATRPLGHCALSGPSVSKGRVFVGSGNMLQFATIPPGDVTAFGL
jgi:polyvinyl alcohol dehydrogenase (cytochrome)